VAAVVAPPRIVQGYLDLLERLFENILLPPTVARELQYPPARYPPIDPSQFHYLRVLSPGDISQVQKFQATLDAGEAEALVLAIETRADFVLIDELAGRNMAHMLGMVPLGAVGILLRARQHNLIDSILPLIDRLQSELNFFISPSLRQEIISRAGE
jgi:predicted nucleic acid-binding protein